MPTPTTILEWIAAAGGQPWFPSAHAHQSGTPRDSLDEPLNELRLAGLIQVVDWVRGAGQGYVLTPNGKAAVGDASTLQRLPITEFRELRPEARGEPLDEIPAEPDPELAAQTPSIIDVRPPVVTPALLGANILWFLVGLLLAMRMGIPASAYLGEGNAAVLSRLGALEALDLLHGQWWRLLTSCFVHVGVIHLVLNMFVLGMMGPLAEMLWGRSRLLIIYLFSGLGGSCLAMALSPTNENGTEVLLAGASGAICGVFTSVVAWFLLFRTYLPTDLVSEWGRRLGLVSLAIVGQSLFPGVSWQAHLGGAITGFLAAGLLNAMRFADQPRRIAAVVLLAVLPVLAVIGLVLAIRSAPMWIDLQARLLAERNTTQHPSEANPPPNRDVVPLLNQLNPESVRPIEREAAYLLILGPQRRPDPVAAVRQQVSELRRIAVETVSRASGPPTTKPEVDAAFTKVRAFAEARVRSFDLLLAMLDGSTTPDVPTWQAWGASHREAERLWADEPPPR